ncbi:3-deoxy-D-manno-octulosonic-acid transferase [Glaciecola sp. KUL10]|nr:3-deoxy-D-manno-octulosonic-acid transferase [Glaciecola sp. KUL10]
MGEVNAAEGVVRGLIKSHPSIPITLTCTSITGAQQAVRLYGNLVQHAFLPIDFPLFNHLMLTRLQPKGLIITEVEVWPNLVHQCYVHKIPKILINARMTSRSLTNYKKLAFLYRPTLRKFDAICAQGQLDFENFINLGVYKRQLHLSNNLKFDLTASVEDEGKANMFAETFGVENRTVLLGASTHEGEEKALLKVFKKLKCTHDDLLLILVPRYPHRFEEVAILVNAMGFQSTTVSAKNTEKHNDVIVVDQMGMLKAMYRVSTLCFVGGSLVDRGGHNPLEAALYHVPICMGPSTFNNPLIVSALTKAQALDIVNDEDSLFNSLDTLLNDLIEAQARGEKGHKVIESNAGATQKTLAIIEESIA